MQYVKKRSEAEDTGEVPQAQNITSGMQNLLPITR